MIARRELQTLPVADDLPAALLDDAGDRLEANISAIRIFGVHLKTIPAFMALDWRTNDQTGPSEDPREPVNPLDPPVFYVISELTEMSEIS